MITLRPYQIDAIEAWGQFLKDGGKRGIIHLPTGCGKTITALSAAKKMGGRMLWLAHRGELLDQAIKATKLVWPKVSCGVVKAERNEIDAHCVFATVQTISRRLYEHKEQKFDLIVVDEAHHSVASTYVNTLDIFGAFEKKGAVVLGLTATPERGDKLGLENVFQEIVYSMQMTEAIAKGYLCDLMTSKVFLDIDFDKVKITAGDFNQGQLNEILLKNQVPRKVAEAYVNHAKGRKAIVFTVSKEQAKKTCEELRKLKVKAEYLTGDTDELEREEILTRLKTGETMVLVNCLVLTEGFDEPSVDAIIMARPTKSKPLYIQCIGRGTRKYIGKENCLILDITGNSEKHKLVTASTLFGLPHALETDSIIAEIKKESDREEKLVDIELEQLKKMVYSPEAVKMRESVSWVKCNGDLFTLSAGRGGQVLISRAEADSWRVWAMFADESKNKELTPFAVDRELAQGIAEEYIRENKAADLVNKDAAWKNRPATSTQLNTLKKFRYRNIEGITCGEASEKITRSIALMNAKKLNEAEVIMRRKL